MTARFIFKSPDEPFRSAKIFEVRRKFLQRFRRDACIKSIGLVPFLVEKRLRAEDGMVRENGAAEDNGIGPRETVFANLDRLRRLPACAEIDAVGEQLGTKSADRSEGPDSYSRRAIDQMPAANSRVLFDDQLWAPIRLMREMPARAG